MQARYMLAFTQIQRVESLTKPVHQSRGVIDESGTDQAHQNASEDFSVKVSILGEHELDILTLRVFHLHNLLSVDLDKLVILHPKHEVVQLFGFFGRRLQ